MSKWIFRIFSIIIILFVSLLIYIEVNREEIVRQLVSELNKSLKTPVTYDDSDVSLLRSFPHLQVSLYDIAVKDSLIKELPLIQMGEFSVNLNLIDAIRNNRDITIERLILSDGDINIITGRNGDPNYAIFKESNETTDDTLAQPDITLNAYQIKSVNIRYIDIPAGSSYNIQSIESKGSLKFLSEGIFVKNEASMKVNGGPLESPLSIVADIGLRISPAYDDYTIEPSSLKINHLPVEIGGNLTLSDDDIYSYNIDFKSPSTDVKELFSLLPQVYRNDYESIISQGTFSLKGQVNGFSNADYPKYHIELSVKDGKVKYPDLPKSIDRVAFDLIADNNAYETYYSVIDLKNIMLKMGQSQVGGMLNARSIKGNHQLKVDLDTDLDMSDVYESFKWTDITSLSGILKGNAKLATTIDDKSGEPILNDQIFSANMELKNFALVQGQGENTTIKSASVNGTKDILEYKVEELDYPGISSVHIDGHLVKPLSLLEESGRIQGDAKISVRQIDYIKLSAVSDTAATTSYAIPHISIDITGVIDEVIYPPYLLKGITADGKLSEKESQLNFNIASINDQSLAGTAVLTNLLQYGLNNDTLRGFVDIRSAELNLEQLMGDTTSDTSSASEPIIPPNIDLSVNYDVDRVTYNNIDLSKAIGDMTISDRKVSIKNQAKLFDGELLFTAIFDDANPLKRNINLSVEIKKISFARTAAQIKLFNTILPIAPYFQGEYNGTFNWASDLSEAYYPVLNTVSAFGEIETKNGAITNFLPVDTVLQFFNGKVAKSEWKLSDIKRYFLIRDGRVVIKEVELTKEDIKVSFNGSHGFDQTLDYNMILTIPQGKLNIDKLSSFIASKLKVSDKLKNLTNNVDIDLVLRIGGKFTRPSFDVLDVRVRKGDVVESLTDAARQTIENEKTKVENTIKDTLNVVKNTVKDSLESLKNKAEGKIDSVRSEIDNSIKTSKNEIDSTFNTMLDSLKAGNIDSLGNKIDDLFKGQQDKINILKGKLKTNILKKKDKN